MWGGNLKSPGQWRRIPLNVTSTFGNPDCRDDGLGVGAITVLDGIKLYRPQGAVAVTIEQETTRVSAWGGVSNWGRPPRFVPPVTQAYRVRGGQIPTLTLRAGMAWPSSHLRPRHNLQLPSSQPSKFCYPSAEVCEAEWFVTAGRNAEGERLCSSDGGHLSASRRMTDTLSPIAPCYPSPPVLSKGESDALRQPTCFYFTPRCIPFNATRIMPHWHDVGHPRPTHPNI